MARDLERRRNFLDRLTAKPVITMGLASAVGLVAYLAKPVTVTVGDLDVTGPLVVFGPTIYQMRNGTAAPSAPTGVSAVVIDTSTVYGMADPFSGAPGDTQASIRIQVDTVTGDFSSPLMDSTQTGTAARDTLSRNAGYNANGTYKMRALYTGVAGGASAWSAPDTFVNAAPLFSDGFESGKFYTIVSTFTVGGVVKSRTATFGIV